MNRSLTRLAAAGILLLWFAQVGAYDWPACGVVESFPGQSWQAANAADRGWDTDRLAAAQALFETLDSAAVMVVHRGDLIGSWGDTTTKFTAQSLRKSLLNSLVGVSIDEKTLRIDATLEDLDIDDSEPRLTDFERQATVRDLLLSRSGIFHSALYEVGRWKRHRAELAALEAEAGEDVYGPGDYWMYNNWDFNALGSIVERASGLAIGRFFETAVAAPTGMEDFASEDVEYTSKDSQTEQHFRNWSEHRAYVFNVSTRDLARYGLLYLNCGNWGDRSVVPTNWVLESIEGIDTRIGRPPEHRDTGFGHYGYLWQIDRDNRRRYEGLVTTEPFYMGTGSRGHVLVVMPYLDLVIAHQVATVGGVGFDAQYKRATQGSPRVSNGDIGRLIAAILAAHPQNQQAAATEQHDQ